MPPRLERRQNTGNTHFITFSCSLRNPYLVPCESKIALQTVIENIRNRYRFHVYGYVIMPEHLHLLMSEPELKPLDVAVAVIKREVSSLLVEKPFWLPRYYDFNVFTDAKRVEKLRYIHRNPVSRGLVEHPEDYIWSSFRAYALREPNPITITLRKRCSKD
ncbi:MAG TPA: transposase [Acidobacteriaceae bacterium]